MKTFKGNIQVSRDIFVVYVNDDNTIWTNKVVMWEAWEERDKREDGMESPREDMVYVYYIPVLFDSEMGFSNWNAMEDTNFLCFSDTETPDQSQLKPHLELYEMKQRRIAAERKAK